jgi:hypothetical protein
LEIYDKEWIDDWHDGDSKKDYYLKGKEVLKKFYNDLLLKPLNIYFLMESQLGKNIFFED